MAVTSEDALSETVMTMTLQFCLQLAVQELGEESRDILGGVTIFGLGNETPERRCIDDVGQFCDFA